jgi:acyl dehydratase
VPVDPSFAGRVYPPTEPYQVSREKIREFADAINDPNPAYRDRAAAQALGHPDVHTRPIHAGDELQVVVSVESIRAAAGNDLVTTKAELSTTTGELVTTAHSTIVARGTAV